MENRGRAVEVRSTRHALWLSVLVLLSVYGLCVWRYQPPAARPAESAAGEFSAVRAQARLARVIGQRPHPVGSAENRRVRERLVRELTAIGLSVQVQRGFACSRWGSCADVENVIARLPGQSELPAVMLAAHYDSVPAGPGAADDGAGVATLLEVARAIKAGPSLERPLLLVVTDGEEAGLLGAEVFSRSTHDAIHAVLNFEARGSSGPSMMFETSDGNAELIASLTRCSKRPVTSSAFYAVYKRLPNDSDFSVFRRHGMRGLNFAFIDRVAHYHTPLDDLAHLDSGSLQQHGDNALALTRELGGTSAEGQSSSDAVFFDVLAFTALSWQARYTPALSALALLLLGTGAWLASRRLGIGWGALLAGALPWLGNLVLASLLGAMLEVVLTHSAVPVMFIAHPLPVLVSIWSAAFLASSAMYGLARRLEAFPLWFGAALGQVLLSAACLAALPGAVFLGLLPCLVFGAACYGWRRQRADGWMWFSLLAPALTSWLLLLPVLHLLYPAVGFASITGFCVLAALALSTLAPAFALAPARHTRLLMSASSVLLVGATCVASFSAPFSPERPQRLSLALHEDHTAGKSRYLVDASWGRVPARIMEAGKFDPRVIDPTPWFAGFGAAAHAAPAPAPGLSPPQVEVLERGEGASRQVRLRATSRRGANIISLWGPVDALRTIRINGTGVSPRAVGESARVVHLSGGSGTEFELTLLSPAPVSITVADHSDGLPESASFLRRARPASAVPSQFGDGVVVSTTLQL